MYGPVPTAPPRQRAGRVGIMVARVILTPLPVLSMGFLAWVPMLYLAIAHRRTRDWLIFSAITATTVIAFAMIGDSDNDHSWQDATGIVTMFGMGAFVPAYFLVVDLGLARSHETRRPESAPITPSAFPQPGYPPLGGYRHDRIEQVRSGLDELSAYLKQQDHS